MPITLDGTAGITTPAISGDAIATQAEAEAGTNNTKLMTPLRVEQSLVATVATQAEAEAGTDNTKLMSPLRAAQSVSRFVPDVENRIINGAFDFWQRGTSFTTVAYGADRWANSLNGGTVTQSRQAFSSGDTLGSNNPMYFLRQTVSGQSTASDLASTYQNIEGVRSYAGQTITILGWARRSSGSGNMAVEPVQSFGTGGSPSSAVFVTPQIVTLTGSFAPFALTFAIPSISGKTLGSNNNDHLRFTFWTSAGSDYNARTNSLGLQTIGVDLWGIHIKVGTHTAAATDRYRQPELGPELARCQRYYEKSYNLDVVPGTNTSIAAALLPGSSDSSSTTYYQINFAVLKRGTPSITTYRTTGTVSVWDYTRSGLNSTTTPTLNATFGAGLRYATLSLPVGAVFVPVTVYGHWVADAEL